MTKYEKFSRVVLVFILCLFSVTTKSQDLDSIALANLNTIDPGLLPYFPRWKICEPNLQLQIQQVFRLSGRPKENLDMKRIIVTAAPIGNQDPEEAEEGSERMYNILLLECGNEILTSDQLESKMGALLGTIKKYTRPYCFTDIPIASPATQAQIEAITNYLEMPTNVTHSFSLSAFEQTMKFGKEDGYWVRSIIGTESAGMPFISAGEAKVLIQHPLYVNDGDVDIDPNLTLEEKKEARDKFEMKRKAIPHLLNFHIGMGYRLQDTSNGALNFLPQRRMNAGYGGKGIFGFDFHVPTMPEFGISFHVEVPMQAIDTLKTIERGTYSAYFKENPNSPRDPLVVAPLLRITGNAGLFYNWWLDYSKPENFVRFDLGINYTEVREVAIQRLGNDSGPFVLNDKAEGLNFYHPTEFLDWLYAKVEYRSQSTFPFGLSAQYSNQAFMGRLYLPLVGQWLYLDARYSIPLRSESRPFEQSIFMISPVLRLNI
jgi:hypothetical protein